MAVTFYAPDLLAVRQRLSEYNANVRAVSNLIAAGAPLAEVSAAYKRLRLEIKVAYADATMRADDLTDAERTYWQRPITDAAAHLHVSASNDDAAAFRQSLFSVDESFSYALSTIDKALR